MNVDGLAATLRDGQHKALSVEDPALLARARQLVPLQELRDAAQELLELRRALADEPAGINNSNSLGELLVIGLLRWFKHSFFRWVDAPPCSWCGGASTLVGGAEPTAEERAHGAARVELYRCNLCEQPVRFPRFTDPGKLLETRQGRCGEWSHCFLLFLRAAGFDARHVSDNADHVWCEFHSEAGGRWVHVDPCEAAFDTPLLYESGWGKALSYVLAASRHGPADVTRRYVVPPCAAKLRTRRDGTCDAWLRNEIVRVTGVCRADLSVTERRELAARDAAELLQLMVLEEDGTAAAGAANLPGRQTGSEAWRTARGETGAATASAQPAPSGTDWCYARDRALPGALFAAAGRISGGACRASGEHGAAGQVAACLFDAALSSKWLDFGGGGVGGSGWVEYRLLPAAGASGGDAPRLVVAHYDLISAEDCGERDPCDWVLEAGVSANGVSSSSGASGASGVSGDGWLVVDRRSGHRFDRRQQLASFTVPAAGRVPSCRWRLRVTRVREPAAATCVQLACLNLYSAPAAGVAQPAPAGSGGALLYASAADCEALAELGRPGRGAHAAGAAADPSAPAAGSSGASSGADVGAPGGDAHLATLRRILGNACLADAKFFRLSTTSAKLGPLLQQPLLLRALLAAGFRPVRADAAGDVVQLVADDRPDSGTRPAVRRLLQLLDGQGAAAGGGGSAA